MDVLKPKVKWVNGKCFRINSADSEGCDYPKYIPPPKRGINYSEECPMDEDDDEFEIEIKSNGYFKTVFPIPQFYYGSIIGTKGTTKKALENETNTEIKIPKSKTNNEIEIHGKHRRDVASARRRILLIVQKSRKRQEFTHFLSIPCNSKYIQNRFLEFKKEILEEKMGTGIEESIFIPPEKLHLTFGMLVLMDDTERSLAASTLQSFQQNYTNKLFESPLDLKLHGIEYMNDDPSQVNVLYAKVSPGKNSEILQQLADDIVEHFVKAGLMEKEKEHVKLHMTLMNTKYRNQDQEQPEAANQRKFKPRITFDARKIISTFANFEFGTQQIKTIELSTRHALGPEGYYKVSAKIDLAQ